MYLLYFNLLVPKLHVKQPIYKVSVKMPVNETQRPT